MLQLLILHSCYELKQHAYAVAVMMYGFGDDPSPYKESVDLVEV